MNEELRNENIEETELTEVEESDDYDPYQEEDSGSGMGLALIIGGLTAGGAALAYAYKRFKEKKDGKPRKKKRLRWVEVEDDEIDNVVCDVEAEVLEDCEEG